MSTSSSNYYHIDTEVRVVLIYGYSFNTTDQAGFINLPGLMPVLLSGMRTIKSKQQTHNV